MRTELAEIWPTICRVLRDSPAMDEANTRMRVITPLIQGLGWDIFGGDVQNEYEITYGSGRVRVDYALLIDGRPRIFVEAKSLNTVLSDDHASQVISYAKSRDVRWCVLTNGSELRIYNAAWGTEPSSTLLEIIRIDPDRDPPDRLRLLSRASVASGELDRLATKSRFSQRISAHLSKLLPDLKEEWVKEAGNKVFAAVKNELDKVTRKQVKDAVAPLLRIDLDGSVRPPDGGGGDGNGGGGGGGPMGENYTPMRRTNLPGPDNSLVAVFPSRPAGEEFLRKFNAWGFVSLRGNPRFCAIYFTKPEQSIRIVASISRIIPASAWLAANKDKATERDLESYDPDKSVIEFKPTEAWELEDPVPWESGDPVIYGLRYTSLGDLRRASQIGDLRTPEHRFS